MWQIPEIDWERGRIGFGVLVALALDDDSRIAEVGVVPGVVKVEVGADENIDVVGGQAEFAEPISDVVFWQHDRGQVLPERVVAKGGLRIFDMFAVHPCIDQDPFALVGLDQEADDRNEYPLADTVADR